MVKSTIWQERIDRNVALYEKLDSGKAYQGGESIFPDFGRIGRTGLESAKRGGQPLQNCGFRENDVWEPSC